MLYRIIGEEAPKTQEFSLNEILKDKSMLTSQQEKMIQIR